MLLPAVCWLMAPAWSHESVPQPVIVSDTAVLYTGSNVDTDWVPSGSPIAVRFQIVSEGGAAVDMEGEANLSWPDPLTLSFLGDPGTGELLVDAALSAVTSVQFSLFGYTYESELDRRTVAAGGEATFDPFALSGGGVERVEVTTAGATTELITYDLEVFAGVGLSFEATLTPTGTTGFSGVAFWADDAEITTEGGEALIAPTGEPSQSMMATFVGAWDSVLALNITPAVSVCFSIFGCEELASFDIPLTLASDDFEQAAPAVPLEFPLPVIETPSSSYDLGEVLVGSLANLELPIGDAGELAVEGEIGVTGSPYFSVFPGYFYAGPGAEDGAVVTFAPESAGTFTATLLLSSNDPNTPIYEVEVTGTGVAPEEDEPDAPDDDLHENGADGKVSTCGCASDAGGMGTAALWPLLGLVAVLSRRRAARAGRADEVRDIG